MKYRFFTNELGTIWKMPVSGTGWIDVRDGSGWQDSICTLADMDGTEIPDPDQNAPQSSVEPFKNDLNIENA